MRVWAARFTHYPRGHLLPTLGAVGTETVTSGLRVVAGCRRLPTRAGFRSIGAGALALASGRPLCVLDKRPTVVDSPVRIDPGALIFLVDGMEQPGPLSAPSWISASSIAIDAIGAEVRASPRPELGAEAAWLMDVVERASERASAVTWGSLAATLAVVLVRPENAWIAHVGDVVVAVSRQATPGLLTALTSDHTLGSELRAQGKRAETDPQMDNILTRCFGAFAPQSRPDLVEISFGPGDRLVLAPRVLFDGIVSATPEEALSSTPDVVAELLLNKAERQQLRKPAVLVAQGLPA
jgi:Protein phosphatase 2C